MATVEVKVEPDGWWTWKCKTHGKAAFLHKTARDAEIEAAQHNERHAFSSRIKVDIWVTSGVPNRNHKRPTRLG